MKKQTEKLFWTYGYDPVSNVVDADIVAFLGGTDINPELYGEKPAGSEPPDLKRDSYEIGVLAECHDKFLVGICRGAQFLNCVLNFGSLWQDVDGHNHGNHKVTDKITGQEITVNSLHHQQMRVTQSAEIIASTHVSRVKDGYTRRWHVDEGPDEDIEAAYYADTRSLLIQWHPQLNPHGEPGIYFQNIMERYYCAA